MIDKKDSTMVGLDKLSLARDYGDLTASYPLVHSAATSFSELGTDIDAGELRSFDCLGSRGEGDTSETCPISLKNGLEESWSGKRLSVRSLYSSVQPHRHQSQSVTANSYTSDFLKMPFLPLDQQKRGNGSAISSREQLLLPSNFPRRGDDSSTISGEDPGIVSPRIDFPWLSRQPMTTSPSEGTDGFCGSHGLSPISGLAGNFSSGDSEDRLSYAAFNNALLHPSMNSVASACHNPRLSDGGSWDDDVSDGLSGAQRREFFGSSFSEGVSSQASTVTSLVDFVASRTQAAHHQRSGLGRPSLAANAGGERSLQSTSAAAAADGEVFLRGFLGLDHTDQVLGQPKSQAFGGRADSSEANSFFGSDLAPINAEWTNAVHGQHSPGEAEVGTDVQQMLREASSNDVESLLRILRAIIWRSSNQTEASGSVCFPNTQAARDNMDVRGGDLRRVEDVAALQLRDMTQGLARKHDEKDFRGADLGAGAYSATLNEGGSTLGLDRRQSLRGERRFSVLRDLFAQVNDAATVAELLRSSLHQPDFSQAKSMGGGTMPLEQSVGHQDQDQDQPAALRTSAQGLSQAQSHLLLQQQQQSTQASLGQSPPQQSRSSKVNSNKHTQRKQFFKTRYCPHFYGTKGCKRGSNCNYAHGTHELQPSVDLTKTKLCAEFMENGRCRATNCTFAHGLEELRTATRRADDDFRFSRHVVEPPVPTGAERGGDDGRRRHGPHHSNCRGGNSCSRNSAAIISSNSSN